MAIDVRRVQYYHVTVKDEPGAAYRILTGLAGAEVNLLAFHAYPAGQEHTQLMLFPEDPEKFVPVADQLGLVMFGPQEAFLVRGDDRLGALAELHQRLFDANINVYSSSGISDGAGHFGYLLYVRGQDYDSAARALGI